MATTNPLNDFNTYSYHHFLVLVNSTAAAESLKDDNLFFRFANGEAEIPGARMVVNPIKSMRYVIQELSWTNWIAMNYEDFGGTVGSGGEFRIIEPNGMSFFNDLFGMFLELGCGTATSQWVLKTMFVGQTNVGDSGQPSVEYINNVNPLLLVVLNVDAMFTEAGGDYTFQFAAAGSGAGLTPSSGGSVFEQRTSLNLAGTDASGAVTLEQALQTLNRHMNTTSEQAYKKTEEIRANQGDNYPAPFKSKHVIIIPDELKRPEYTLASPVRTASGADGSTPMLTVSPGTGAIPAIMSVIKMCTPLMQSSTTPGQLREHFVVASQVLDNDTQTQTYYYTIKERAITPIKNAAAKDGGSNTGGEAPADEAAKNADNFLEYDYLYTGKNIDVLGYEMKMGEGLAFLQGIINLSAVPDNRAAPTATKNMTSASNATEVGTNTSIPQGVQRIPNYKSAHRMNPSATAAYEQLLQQHSVLNVLATIKIRGNPRLLNDVTPTVDAQGSTDAKRTPMGVMANYSTQPSRVKVNVRMPKDGDLDTIEDFWYKGTYLIMSVKSDFANGEFTQELQTVAEMDGVFENKTETKPVEKPAEPVVPVSIVGETADAAARIRAFLATIRYCEGTLGDRGYTTLFGYGQFSGFDDHPRFVVVTPNYKSSAAGAYQIIQKTWDELSKPPSRYAAMLPDFRPETQDVAGWCLLDQKRALPAIREGRITDALFAVRKVWASLPDATYGQPTKRLNDVLNVYNKFLIDEVAGVTTLKASLEALV